MRFSNGLTFLVKLYTHLNIRIKKKNQGDKEMMYNESIFGPTEQMKEIKELGLHTWRTHMIEPLEEDLVGQLLAGIKHDRMGGAEGGSHFLSDFNIRGVIDSLASVEEWKEENKRLDLYVEVFEKPFLAATREYYREEAAKLRVKENISHYMEQVIIKIEAEDDRCRKFLFPLTSTIEKVGAEVVECMVTDHLTYLSSEIDPLISGERWGDLANLYRQESIPCWKMLSVRFKVLSRK